MDRGSSQDLTEESEAEKRGLQGLGISRQELIREQEEDPELKRLSGFSLSMGEAEKEASCYYKEGDGLLMRKWSRPAST
ncbi:hypothetical protein, partial [Escherichia coli]|uniref:hypothetical protein n=1 Tax=Escherichia coli TaxID=562 RepID=UPI00307A3859